MSAKGPRRSAIPALSGGGKTVGVGMGVVSDSEDVAVSEFLVLVLSLVVVILVKLRALVVRVKLLSGLKIAEDGAVVMCGSVLVCWWENVREALELAVETAVNSAVNLREAITEVVVFPVVAVASLD
jgi:hypothetical protein